MTATQPRFDLDTLRATAGETVFARGTAYHAKGQVEIVAVEPQRVVARVLGTEVYRTELKGAGRGIDGQCSCPAFSNWGFCKHLVATALAANSLQVGDLVTVENRFARIRAHLRKHSVEVLADMLMSLAERDGALLQQLELAAAAAAEDDATLFRRFKAAITDATRTHGFVEYQDAHAWGQRIETVLDQIEQLARSGRAALALRLLDHLFSRLERALSSVDDSDGHAGQVFARAADIHLAACRTVRPDPVPLARELFDRETGSDWDFFANASETYADILGPVGRAEYRRLAEEAWAKIKPLKAGDKRIRDDQAGERFRLMQILDGFAAEADDVDLRISLRSKDLSCTSSYLGIVDLLVASGREGEPLRWAEEGVWLFEDEPDERLTFVTADLYRSAGRHVDAESLLWRAFERRPNLETYGRIRALVEGHEAVTQTVADRAIGFLRERTAEAKAKHTLPWAPDLYADLLVRLLIQEKRIPDALDAWRAYGGSEAVLRALALESEASQPQEALKLYGDLVDRAITAGGRQGYEQACTIIERMRGLRARLGESGAHASYVAELMNRHKAKRSFIKLLRALPEELVSPL